MMDTPKNFFNSFEQQLKKNHDFPCIYIFKFITLADNRKISMIEAMFDETALITTKESTNKKYISISIKTVMSSTQTIINIYKKATKIDGIIAL